MELKPYGIYVSVAYPPDTDTPGYELEMESKPSLTKRLSESGSVFLPKEVAVDMVNKSTIGECLCVCVCVSVCVSVCLSVCAMN
jgi:3-dehydrosphinganine reductase